MDKHEVNRLLFCMKERDELKDFRSDLNKSYKTMLVTEKIFKFKIFTNFLVSKEEHSLTEIQSAKLYAFLDEQVKYLEHHLANAAPEEKEIAEAIYNGEISKDTMDF